jgi:hypothetical protein
MLFLKICLLYNFEIALLLLVPKSTQSTSTNRFYIYKKDILERSSTKDFAFLENYAWPRPNDRAKFMNEFQKNDGRLWCEKL